MENQEVAQEQYGDLRLNHIGLVVEAQVQIVEDLKGKVTGYLRRVDHSEAGTFVSLSDRKNSKASTFKVIPGTLVNIYA